MVNSRTEGLNAGGISNLAHGPSAEGVLFTGENNKLVCKFTEAIKGMGGEVIPVKTIADIRYHLLREMDHNAHNITNIPLLSDIMETMHKKHFNPWPLQNVDNVVIEARLAVAENGAIWFTEDIAALRTLPFSCRHLAVIVNAKDIVATMHEADACVNTTKYGFGYLISAPAKSAGAEPLFGTDTNSSRGITVFLKV